MYLNKDYTESRIHPVLWNSYRRRVGLRQLSGMVKIGQCTKGLVLAIWLLVRYLLSLRYVTFQYLPARP